MMRYIAALACLVALLELPAGADELLFQLSGDEPIQAQVNENIEFVEGKYGKAIRFGEGSLLRFSSEGTLNRRRGTVCTWIRPHWDAQEIGNHAFFVDDRDFKTGNNSLTLWQWHTGSLRFDVRDEKDSYLNFGVPDWKQGQWHHVAAAWDCEVGSWLFFDGDLVAGKKLTWEPKSSEFFQFGADRHNRWATDADLDDIRIYDCPLRVAQLGCVMAGKKLRHLRYLGLEVPDRVEVGSEFDVTLRFEAVEALDDDCTVAVLLDDIQVACHPLARKEREGRVGLSVAVPSYLYPSAGKHVLSATVSGTFERDPEKARREIDLVLPRCKPVPSQAVLREMPDVPDDGGLFVRGRFLPKGELTREKLDELRMSGQAVDVLACRLIDKVDCSKTDHGYWENSPATLEELIPGTRFRCVGPQEKVTQLKRRHNREHKALPAFAYRLEVKPRPTPHLVVVESINDAERYLEVAIDHPRDSKPAPHLAASGVGSREAIHLGVTYSGGEYGTDGKTYRQTFMIFPKTDTVDVMISGTNRRHFPDASPAAVSRIQVYEVAAPLSDLVNPISLPPAAERRSVSVFFPAIHNLFEKYGFAGTDQQMRASTLRLFIDYMRFLGMNRFELRPFQLSSKAHFKTPRFEQAGELDFFAEALPLMQEAGIDVVPRVMYLHSYHKLVEDDEDNFQHGVDGAIQKFGREGPIPDPLRPPVQKVILDSIRAFLEACEGYGNVPAVGFDTSIGGLYWNRKAPTSHSGYSEWNVRQFAKETGTNIPVGLDTPQKRFDWLKANSWDEWIQWRCKAWHRLCTQIRDLATEKRKKLELSVRVMPREEFHTEGVPIKTIYQYTGYDPDLFRGESDIIMDYFVRINADRYFGRSWWKPWFYDAEQPGLFVSKEPRHVELYFNYWEIPLHPWGFRVGPGSPVGRNFFEPLTYAMRTMNPYDVTLFNWFRASIGREFEIRQFSRAFRSLPAVEPRDFDGEIQSNPMDDRLWVKWFADRLAVVNDAGYERTVTLAIPVAEPKKTRVFDAALCRDGKATPGKECLIIRLDLRPFDFRTLVMEKGRPTEKDTN